MDTRKVATEFRLSQWAQMIQGRMERQQSIKTFCQEAGVSENTYYYWQRKVREAFCERVTEIPGEIAPTGTRARGFTEVKLVETPRGSERRGATETGRLHVEMGEIKITVDSTYPAEKLAVLLRGIVRSC